MQRATVARSPSEQTTGSSLMLRVVLKKFARPDRLFELVEGDVLCCHLLMRMLGDAQVF